MSSIASSVVVRTSPILRALSVVMSCGAVLIGALVATGAIGEVSTSSRVALALGSVFLGFFGFYHGARHRKHQHIDISGTGQIRLSEWGETRSCAAANRPNLQKNGQVVHLLPSSTLWRWMLLLRLRTESGRVITVPVMPDSVSRDGFRALAIASRWILSRVETND